jgi:hypothetical protein
MNQYNRRENPCGLFRVLFAIGHETMDIFADQIRFDVDFITNPAGAQISVPQGERNDRDGEAPAAAGIDR